MPRKSRTNSEYAARLVKQQQALHLRIHGHNFRSIAKALGCSISLAHKLCDEACAEERAHISAAKADLVETELIRCDTYLQAIAKKVQLGDVRAVDTALKVAERRARLLGLDAPTKQEVEIKDPECLIIRRRSDG